MNIMWLLIIVASLVLAIRFLMNAKSDDKLPQSFIDLIKKVQTEENKAQIESSIAFHNSRVAAGADGGDSYDRMISDIRRIGDVEEKETAE